MKYIYCIIASLFVISCTKIDLGRGKPLKPAPVCLLLDYDGHDFYIGAPATVLERQLIRDSVASYYARWRVTVTENEQVYNSFSRKWRVAVTNSSIGFLGVTPQGGLINNTGDYSVVWYYGAQNNIAPIHYSRQLARMVAHEFAHALDQWHREIGLMKPYPFDEGDTFFTEAEISAIDKIIRRN